MASLITITGTDGDDLLFGLPGINIINGLGGDDDIFSIDDLAITTQSSFVNGGDGDDQITTDDGNDEVLGDLGDDVILTDGGNDTVLGGDGNDIVDGADGNDRIFGEVGDDVLNGGTGDDVMQGDEGADTLIGGTGSDFLSGGLDADIINSHSRRTSTRTIEKDVIFGGEDTGVIDTINLFANYTGGTVSTRATGRGADSSFAVLADFEQGTDELNVLNRPNTYSVSYGNGPTSPDYQNRRGIADSFIINRGNLVAVVIDTRLEVGDLTQVV